MNIYFLFLFRQIFFSFYNNKYSTKEDKEIQLYLCKDQYENIYLFRITSATDYTVELDSYTLDNPITTPIYDKASNMNKGLMNADKFFEMLNMQDYETAYSVLDNSFKQNYFKTQSDFEKYIKNKLFKFNKVEYTEYNNQISGLHGYKVIVTDATEESSKQVEFNIVMKLEDSSNFTMSFQVS